MSVLDAIYTRHATRTFTPEVISEAQIRALLDAAVHAPTAMHLEPWAFVVVQDRAVLHKISDRAKSLAALPANEMQRELARPPAPLVDPTFNIFYDAGTLIVICAKPINPFVFADCWLAAENLMLAATAMHLATCPIGYATSALMEPDVQAELGIPPGTTTFAPIIVGVPAGSTGGSKRRPPEIWAWKK
jgi:nitroreductase